MKLCCSYMRMDMKHVINEYEYTSAIMSEGVGAWREKSLRFDDYAR